MKEVKAYQTIDKKLFSSKEEAERHEAEILFRFWCDKEICRGGPWDSQMVADEILDYWNLTPKPNVGFDLYEKLREEYLKY